MKTSLFLLFGTCLAIVLAGTTPLAGPCAASVAGGGCYTLYAGQNLVAGQVCVTPNAGLLEITYSTTGGWELTEAHLWVGNAANAYPQTKNGNPKVGNFPYQSGNIAGATSYTFTVANPLGDLCSYCGGEVPDVYVAAHAGLRKNNGSGGFQTETGWSDGASMVARGSWATLSTVEFNLACSENPPGLQQNCQTAFAEGGRCFLDLGLGFNRWGWTLGPLTPGTYSFPIYAGAAQCDTAKGALVGSLTVIYGSTGTVAVTFQMNPGYTMSETHVYVGSEILPRSNNQFTVAPGQYPSIHNLDGAIQDAHIFFNQAGEIYVIAHAVVCGSF